jgi:hypothetical protein
MKAGDTVFVEAYRAKNGMNRGNAYGLTLTASGQALFTGSSSGNGL